MTESNRSFDDLVAMAREGDSEALGELLEQHRAWLRLLGRSRLGRHYGSRIDESDVAQQTFLSAFDGFKQFNGTSPNELAAWLQRIHDRNLVDAVRRHGKAEIR